MKGKYQFCQVKDCNEIHYGLGYCNPHYQRFKKHGNPLSGGKTHRPNGTGHIAKDGYIVVQIPTHPNANKSGRLPQHVVVMTEKLGRPLKKGETVHHKNGKRADNRIENLELWTKAQPAGQRVTDMIDDAIHLLKSYAHDTTLWSDNALPYLIIFE